MRSVPLVTLALAFSAPGFAAEPTAPAQTGRVEATYLGNEGFLFEAGEHRVLVDALHGDGLEHYVALGAPHREALETASGRFDGIDLVLATHHHADHFDPRAVARFLEHAPETAFVSTSQAADRLLAAVGEDAGRRARVRAVVPRAGEGTDLAFGAIRVRALPMHHGLGRDVENLGFIVEIGGVRLLHVGDTEVTAEELAAYRLPEQGIDVAFVPYWHLLGPQGRAMVVRAIAPARVVAMHVPSADAPPSYFGDPGSLDALVAEIEKHFPGAVPFRDPMDRHTLEGGAR